MATHYGGHLTAKGRIAQKSANGVLMKTELLLEKLVRLDLAKAQGVSLLSDAEIAKVLGMSIHYVERLRTKVAYMRKRMELTTGVGLDADNFVVSTTTKHKQMLKLMLPDALRTIVDSLQSKPTTLAEKKFKFDVAKEVLDREGSFPKISRTDIHQKVEHDFASIDGISKELLDSIQGDSQYEEAPDSILNTLAANSAFSNSATLTAEEQEAALAALAASPVQVQYPN